jgi:carbonic anhydrase
VNWPAGSYLSHGPLVGQYELKQFHFHTPSEHLVDNVAHDVEMHMVCAHAS